jgi:hypothetical protein
MNSTIQKQKPVRTCIKTYKNYSSFKKYIVEDFNNRCGYCDDLDKFNGGKNNYQIDHFKPKKYFSGLETEYSNLVYCCPFCNRAKWDKWKPNGFIDPCTDLYDEHIERNHNGEIKYKSLRGKYIYENLNLYLKRHELLWMIEKIKEQKEELKVYLKNLDKKNKKYQEIVNQFIIYDDKIENYTELYYNEI